MIEGLLEAQSELTEGSLSVPVVLTSRVRLARNFRDFPFPGWAKASQRADILSRSKEALEPLGVFATGSLLVMSELSDLEKQVLVERHLISRELAEGEAGAALYVSRDQAYSIMINEEDHLRIQVIKNGFNLNRVWTQIDELDSEIESKLDYAFTSQLGYLTACPTNVGTGLRASMMMHLPGLVMAGQMEKVIRAVNQLGIAVRGLFGEGSDASGSIFQISNQQTLGETEEDIIKRLGHVLKTVIEQENNSRLRILESDQAKIFDKIGRAFGILQNGHLLSSSESMNLLSLVRLAVDFNLLPEEIRSLVDRYFIEAQPGHIQYAARGVVESKQRDVQRAVILRSEFQKVPALNFDNVDLKT
jgi:protein arginine kinase